MFKNVLVGVDGRPNGRDAIALARRLIDPDGKLTLAHVHSGELRPSRAVTPGLVREERDASERLLERAREAEVERGADQHRGAEPRRAACTCRPRSRAPICSSSAPARAARFGRAMLGDDTRAALNGAPCAVAIASVGYAEHPATDRQDRRRIQRLSPRARRRWRGTGAGRADPRERPRAGSRPDPTYAYTGLVPPALGDSIDEMLEEANEPHAAAARRRGPGGVRARGRGAGRLRRRAWTSSWSARAATGRCGAWCSAAPPTTWSATRAARCSCCPASR